MISTWREAPDITSIPPGRSAPPASITSSAATSTAIRKSALRARTSASTASRSTTTSSATWPRLSDFHAFREEAERKGFRYFLEVFDPNIKEAVKSELLPGYINDMIARMLAGVAPAGRPLFLKMVYHGPKAMEELVRYDPHLVVGILGGSAGTTRDAFQLLHDAQKYGARVALFGRKINNAENQLAFVHFLRLIVERQLDPAEAVRAYHAVLLRLGIQPHRKLEDDLQLTDQAMSYAGGARTSVPKRAVADTTPVPSRAAQSNGQHGTVAAADASCGCHSQAPVRIATSSNGVAGGCACERPRVTESKPSASRHLQSQQPRHCRLFERPPRLLEDEPRRAARLSSRAARARALTRSQPLDYAGRVVTSFSTLRRTDLPLLEQEPPSCSDAV